MNERIIQLETLSALQDETIQNLNNELYRQQLDIAKLAQRIDVLEQKLANLQDTEEFGGNERPPHW